MLFFVCYEFSPSFKIGKQIKKMQQNHLLFEKNADETVNSLEL